MPPSTRTCAVRIAAFSSLAVFCRCASCMRSPTGEEWGSLKASRATVRSARMERSVSQCME
eukprot:1145986-Pelagomonas_calceolata.AAC.2